MNMHIQIRGRYYSINKRPQEGINGELVYELEGSRGARYYTMRNIHTPHMMFLFPAQFTKSNVMNGVWLSDQNGIVEVLKD